MALGLSTALAPRASAQSAPKPRPAAAANATAIRIPFEKYTLPNGLNVVLSQDRTTPTVAVMVTYHVGSKNEEVGRTGFAHLFEHVMFTGSGHVPYGMHDRYTEGVGGFNNGGTGSDLTQYYEEIPSNYLEHALWMEADRMGWLLDALDTAKYNAQRSIVQQERKQRVDNEPYGQVDEIIAAATYPKANPYSWPVIGHLVDLQNAPVSAVKDFFRKYYAPNNTTLTIVGDFDKPQTKAMVAKYFGDIPRGPAIVRPNVARTVLTSERRLVYEDSVQVPLLYISWPTVSTHDPDHYALEVLGDVLTRSRIARLTKALVYDQQSASQVQSYQGTEENTGAFQITITPRPGHSLESLERATDSIIAMIKTNGVTNDEILRSKAGMELGFLQGLESNLGKAGDLGQNNAFWNDPSYGFTKDYAMAKAVTAADVKRVANKYLTSGRVVLSAVPAGKKDLASKASASIAVRNMVDAAKLTETK
jgi:zinc protease